eukprot:170099-Ditylum_brightwellii.AAC.1
MSDKKRLSSRSEVIEPTIGSSQVNPGNMDLSRNDDNKPVITPGRASRSRFGTSSAAAAAALLRRARSRNPTASWESDKEKDVEKHE